MQDADFRTLCAGYGLAVTHQRQVIWDTLLGMHGHPSPEEVYGKVRVRIPSISLATVYNCLETLTHSGLVKQVNLDRGPSRYCPNTTGGGIESLDVPGDAAGRTERDVMFAEFGDVGHDHHD